MTEHWTSVDGVLSDLATCAAFRTQLEIAGAPAAGITSSRSPGPAPACDPGALRGRRIREDATSRRGSGKGCGLSR